MAKHCPVTGDPIDRCDCGGCEPDDDQDPFTVPFIPPPWPQEAS